MPAHDNLCHQEISTFQSPIPLRIPAFSQPEPTLDIDMAEFRHMRSLMIKVQDKAVKIKNLQDKVLPQLKQQLAGYKGGFSKVKNEKRWR